MKVRTRSARRRAGFTLIELLAVVAILALVSTFVAPNLGMLRQRRLTHTAQQLASHIELARQRTVVTGVPHRLWIDLEQAAYRLEWLGEDATDLAGEFVPPPPLDLRGSSPLPLEAPTKGQREFAPLPGMFGRLQILDEDVFIEGLETPEGWVEAGSSWVGFDRNGSADYTEIVIRDTSGREITLAVLPLDDAVRWLDGEA